ncbi:recombinase family protein [bacterium BFN5]|nr:recombinase family protein [bacterium BFN5]QJW46428.1 recombinase family protein [bacterium BFN5]
MVSIVKLQERMIALNFFYVIKSDSDGVWDEYALIQNLYKIDKTFVEKTSVRDSDRPELNRLLKRSKIGDTLFIESFSIIADSLFEFLRIIEQLNKGGLNLVSLHERLDSSTVEGKLRLSAFFELATFERKTSKKLQRESNDISIAEKRPSGRPRTQITENLRKAYLSWKKGKITAVEAMKRSDLKRNTFYKLAKQLDEEFKGVSLFSTDQ